VFVCYRRYADFGDAVVIAVASAVYKESSIGRVPQKGPLTEPLPPTVDLIDYIRENNSVTDHVYEKQTEVFHIGSVSHAFC
jgi:hypothetical protein